MRLLVRIPTAKGPRTFSVSRLSDEDAALIGQALTILGGEFVLREDGSSKPMAQISEEMRLQLLDLWGPSMPVQGAA